MRENIKSVGLILAIAIAGVSLPIGIIGVMKKPSVIYQPIVEEYYYNQTIIEQYNTTIIEQYNTTIIEQYNTTIIEEYNTTVYETITEFYHFTDIPGSTTFFNQTYEITNDTIIIITWSQSGLGGVLGTITKGSWTYMWGDASDIISTGFVATTGNYSIIVETNPTFNPWVDLSIMLIE